MEIVDAERLTLREKKILLTDERTIRIAKQDPDTFINFAMSWNAPISGPNMWYHPKYLYVVPHGQPLAGQLIGLTCLMHREWQESVSDNRKVYIEGPREHSKTTRIMGRIIWELGHNPDLRIKVVYQNDEKASETVTAIGQHILLNPRIKAVFPDLIPDQFGSWSRHKITVKRSIISRDASIEATGILATGVSGRADIIFFDDPVDYKNAIQMPALRAVVRDSFYEVWLNLLPSQFGRVVYICTPWHMKDLSMDIKSNHRDEYSILSNPINDSLDPLWHTKWPREALASKRKEIGSRAFDRGFKLKPLSDEDQLFKPTVFQKQYDFSLRLGQLPGKSSGWKLYTGVDLGISTGSTNTSIFTFAVKKEQRVPIEIKVGRFGELEKIRQFITTYDRWHPEVIAVENNSAQENLLVLMKEMGIKLPVRGLYTGSQKADLDIGLPSLEVEMENGMWLIPVAEHHREEGTGIVAYCGCPVCRWMEECFQFPIGMSDILMSWWIAREGMRSLRPGGNLIHVVSTRLAKPATSRRLHTGFRASVEIGDDEEDD